MSSKWTQEKGMFCLHSQPNSIERLHIVWFDGYVLIDITWYIGMLQNLSCLMSHFNAFSPCIFYRWTSLPKTRSPLCFLAIIHHSGFVLVWGIFYIIKTWWKTYLDKSVHWLLDLKHNMQSVFWDLSISPISNNSEIGVVALHFSRLNPFQFFPFYFNFKAHNIWRC